MIKYNMKIAVFSKDFDYGKMLEYELSERGYNVFAFDYSTVADTVICDIDSVDIQDTVLSGTNLITFSRKEGADLIRPFSVSSLTALIDERSRKRDPNKAIPVLDMKKRKLYYRSKELSLSPLEAKFYNELIKANGEAVSKTDLFLLFKSDRGNDTNSLRVLVNTVRRKIKNEFSLDIIENVRGEGYRINSPVNYDN